MTKSDDHYVWFPVRARRNFYGIKKESWKVKFDWDVITTKSSLIFRVDNNKISFSVMNISQSFWCGTHSWHLNKMKREKGSLRNVAIWIILNWMENMRGENHQYYQKNDGGVFFFWVQIRGLVANRARMKASLIWWIHTDEQWSVERTIIWTFPS